jgi:hypothetical protein
MIQSQVVTVKQDDELSRLPLIFGLIGLALILIMTLVLAFYPFHYGRLVGEVRNADGHLYLKNNSDYEWKDVRMLLNTDYKFNTPSLLPHAEFSVPLLEFAKDDGTKFNPDTTLVDLYITSVTPEKQTISNIFKFQ